MDKRDIADFVLDGHKIHLDAEQRAILAEYRDPDLYDCTDADLREFLIECGLMNGDIHELPCGGYGGYDALLEAEKEAGFYADHEAAENWHFRHSKL